MYEALGISIVLTALGFTFWWVTGDRDHKGWVMAACSLAVLIGMVIFFNERVTELSLENVGTIRTAVRTAQADLREIKELRSEMERQAGITAQLQKAMESAAIQTAALLEDLRDTQASLRDIQRDISRIDQRVQASPPVVQVPTLKFLSHGTTKTQEGLVVTVLFEAGGQIPLGRVEFRVSLGAQSSARIRSIAPAVPIALQALTSVQNDGKGAQVGYVVIGDANPGFRVVLSEAATISITGNYGLERFQLRVP